MSSSRWVTSTTLPNATRATMPTRRTEPACNCSARYSAAVVKVTRAMAASFAQQHKSGRGQHRVPDLRQVCDGARAIIKFVQHHVFARALQLRHDSRTDCTQRWRGHARRAGVELPGRRGLYVVAGVAFRHIDSFQSNAREEVWHHHRDRTFAY